MSAVLELLGGHALDAVRQSFGTAAKLREQLLGLGDNKGWVLSHSECAWRSATYAGTRHTVSIEFAGHSGFMAGEALVALLPDHEFVIPGQIVCEATVKSAERTRMPVARIVVIIVVLLVEKDR